MSNRNDVIAVKYEDFRDEWLSDIESTDETTSSLTRGRRFGAKLISQWLEITQDDDDFFVNDGSHDGGIDLAYLARSDVLEKEAAKSDLSEGDTWYLVQSKLSQSELTPATLITEGQKAISTLCGKNKNLSQEALQLVKKLNSFQENSSENDQIVFVIATVDPISTSSRSALEDVKFIGRERISCKFDVEEISVRSIWESQNKQDQPRFSMPIAGDFVEKSSGLLVGTVSLLDLFKFLKEFKSELGSLDQLYEKNVRQFLGGRRKINQGIARTLEEQPEKFGLYNNGITIVVSGYSRSRDDHREIKLDDPYIVNGCQTTRTIWQVLDSKLNTGGTGSGNARNNWEERLHRGGVVTKIVQSDEAEVLHITRFTNSQNSVREQDFVALDDDFQRWKKEFEDNYNIYLEIQRGGIDSVKAWEKQNPTSQKFIDYVNAFDLIKVYGAGWIGKPGSAFNKNAPFLPNGEIYSDIVDRSDSEPKFGPEDLYAAFLIKRFADTKFGRRAEHQSRRLSRFLFYYVLIQLLKNILLSMGHISDSSSFPMSLLTNSIINLSSKDSGNKFHDLCKSALDVVDSYILPNDDYSIYKESEFQKNFAGDINKFLKSDRLGSNEFTPNLTNLLAIQKAADRKIGHEKMIIDILKLCD